MIFNSTSNDNFPYQLKPEKKEEIIDQQLLENKTLSKDMKYKG